MNEIRKKINEIDKEMAKLFEERMNCAKQIAEYKAEHNLPIFDPTRELEVINNNSKLIQNDEIRQYYVDFLQNTMNVSKRYQEKIIEEMKDSKK